MKRSMILGILTLATLAIITPVAVKPSTFSAAATAAHGQLRIRYEASNSCCADFASLVKQSIVVVRARVDAASPSRLLSYNKPVLVIHPPALLTGSKAAAVASAPTPPPYTGPSAPSEPGIVVTDASVSILDVLKGNGVQPGQALTITQLGGTDPQGRQVVNDGDPLLQVGQDEILFLIQDFDGRYSMLGGAQGRFTIGSTGIVQSLDPGDYPYTKAYSGLTISAFKAAMQAVQ
jgi:hypothetical protein